MTRAWPAFEEPGWSACFESFDQYRDNLYFVVTLRADGCRFVARVDIAVIGEHHTVTELGDHLRAELGRVAATGHTNTAYSPLTGDRSTTGPDVTLGHEHPVTED